MKTKQILETLFNNETLVTFVYDDKEVWLVHQVSAALGYSRGDILGDNIRRKWSDEFVQGHHFYKVLGHEVPEILGKNVCNRLSDGCKTRHALLLTEAGLNRVLLKTRKLLGMQLRDHLDSVVLPQFRRGMISERSYRELEERCRMEVSALKDEVLDLNRQAVRDARELKECHKEMKELYRGEIAEAVPGMREQASAAGKGLAAAKKTKALRKPIH